MSKAREWVSTIADVGVVIGFLLIADQLQQNREALEMDSKNSRNSTFLTSEGVLVGDDGADAYAKAIFNPTKLTGGEMVQFSTYMATAFQAANSAHEAAEKWLISLEDLEQVYRTHASYLEFAAGKVWWGHTKHWFPQKVVGGIDEALRKYPSPNSIYIYQQRMLADLQAIPAQ